MNDGVGWRLQRYHIVIVLCWWDLSENEVGEFY